MGQFGGNREIGQGNLRERDSLLIDTEPEEGWGMFFLTETAASTLLSTQLCRKSEENAVESQRRKDAMKNFE